MKTKSKSSSRKSNNGVKSEAKLLSGKTKVAKGSLNPCPAPEVTQGDLKVHPVLRGYFGYCFYKAAMRYKALLEEAIASTGINSSQLGMLRILKDMGSMSQNDLGNGMGIDKASMAKWIDQLDRRGLVERKENPKDRRIKTVSITQAGLYLTEEVTEIRKRVEDDFVSMLTPEERAIVRSAVPKLLR